jgi:hypothetical protein
MEGGSADNARRIYLSRGAQKVKNIERKNLKIVIALTNLT